MTLGYARRLVPQNQQRRVMTRVKCPYCGKPGLVRSERIFKGRSALTAYYCGVCAGAWQIADDTSNGSAVEIVTRPRQAKIARIRRS